LDIDREKSDRADALKFILHFMGDIHQPLHTGFAKDAGGVRIKLENSRGMSLHEFWDNELLNNQKATTASTWEDIARRNGDSLERNVAFQSKARGSHDFKKILSSKSEILKYVSWIASDTAMTSTCKFGYQDETGHWIENGTSLSEEYIRTRTPMAMISMTKAAVRLAALIDGIAIDSSRRLSEVTAAAVPTLASASRSDAKLFSREAPVCSNRFGVLRFEFNPETCKWEDPENDDDDEDQSTGGTVVPSLVSGPKPMNPFKKKRNPSSSAADSDAADETYLEELIAENAARDAKMTFEGVNLSNVALVVDQEGANIITSIDRAKMKRYEPESVATFKMSFNGGGGGEETSQIFFFDGEIFGYDLSIELAVRCILVISGKPVDGVSDISEYWTPPCEGSSSKMSVQKQVWGPADTEDMEVGPSGFMGFSASGISKISDRFQLKAIEMVRAELHENMKENMRRMHAERQVQLKGEFEVWKSEKNETNRIRRGKQVVSSVIGGGGAAKKGGRRLPIGVPAATTVMKEPPTIEDMWMEQISASSKKILNFRFGKIHVYVSMDTLTTPSVRMRFYSHNAVHASGSYLLMIDPAIFEGTIDRERFDRLSLLGSLNESQKKIATRSRPTWMKELEDLDKVLHGQALDRLDDLKAIQFVHIYGSGFPGCRVIEWATKDAPPSIFDPPGWNFDEAKERILHELIEEAHQRL